MKILQNYEITIIELENGTELMVKKEYFENESSNNTIYKHIEWEKDGEFEDRYEYVECAYYDGYVDVLDMLKHMHAWIIYLCSQTKKEDLK